MEKSEEKVNLYPNIIVTVDSVLIRLHDSQLEVGFIIRQEEPFSEKLALPGGYIRAQEDANDRAAALRVLDEKAHFKPAHLEQLQTFCGALRDPRGYSASIAFLGLVSQDTVEFGDLIWKSVNEINAMVPKDLAFDHLLIVKTALQRLASKSEYTALPAYLMPKEFTLTDLHEAYLLCNPKGIPRRTYTHRIEALGVLRKTDRLSKPGAFRPAALYTLANQMT